MLPSFIRFITKGLQGNTAMDLFCGAGLIGTFLADHFKQLIAVDINKTAIFYAKKNIHGKQHLFFSIDLSKMINQSFSLPLINLIVVNPPRGGLTSEAINFVLKQNPGEIIYVSCNPITQARDVKKLVQNNFKITDHRLFDFYPQTAHVESVLKLKQNQ